MRERMRERERERDKRVTEVMPVDRYARGK